MKKYSIILLLLSVLFGNTEATTKDGKLLKILILILIQTLNSENHLGEIQKQK